MYPQIKSDADFFLNRGEILNKNILLLFEINSALCLRRLLKSDTRQKHTNIVFHQQTFVENSVELVFCPCIDQRFVSCDSIDMLCPCRCVMPGHSFLSYKKRIL